MQEFWENKIQDERISLYPLTPVLELAGILVNGARRHWHPWSTKRNSEMLSIEYWLSDRAKFLRSWGVRTTFSHLTTEQDDYGNRCLPYRSLTNEHAKTDPEIAIFYGSIAFKFLINILPHLEKIGSKNSSLANAVNIARIHQTIETLSEAPYVDNHRVVQPDHLRALAEMAIHLECHCIAISQAMLEDDYARENNIKKRKKSQLSDEAIRKLADEIRCSFETLKAILETEGSSWWEKAKAHRKDAEAVRAKMGFIALDFGNVSGAECYGHVSTHCMNTSEKTTATLIAMLLKFPEKKKEGKIVRQLVEKR